MMTWILTSTAIAALSVAFLKLFEEIDRPGEPRELAGSWERMSDSELDAIVQEFGSLGDQPATKANHA